MNRRVLINYLPDFIQHMVSQRASPHTIKSYQYGVIAFKEALNNAKMPSRSILQSILDELSIKFTPATVHSKVAGLNGFINFLVNEGIVNVNPVNSLKLPKMGEVLPKAIEHAEAARILEECKKFKDFNGVRNRAILELGYGSCARESDLINLKISDIDIASLSFRVVGKGNKEAILYFGQPAKEALIAWFKMRLDHDISSELVFTKQDGSRLSTIYHIVKKLSGHSSHIFLRHTPATKMIEEGADATMVAGVLRHSSLNTTLRYVKLANNRLRNAYDRYHPRT